MRSYLFVAFWWFVVILLYHFEVNFSSFLGHIILAQTLILTISN